MNTGKKLILAGTALMISVAALPAGAAPWVTQSEAYAPFLVAARDDDDFRNEQASRKAKKQEERRNARKHEKEHEEEQGYGYGYERRRPRQDVPEPHFIERRFH